MISSERCQNAIIITTIVAALISSGFIVGVSQYYGGTFALLSGFEVNLAEIQVSNFDPDNVSLYPKITLTFNLKVPIQAEGNVRVPFFGATVWLNDDILSYASFTLQPQLADQYLLPNLNRNITMVQTTNQIDRQTVIDAYLSSSWEWNVTLRCYYLTFDDPNSITWLWFYFYTTNFILT